MPSAPIYKFQVALQEVDHAGVMFFAHLFSRAHDAYAELMESIGFPLHQIIKTGDFHIPLVHAEADYAAPLRHGQLVTVQLQPSAIDNSSFSLEYQFNTNEEQCARVGTRHVVISPAAGRPIPMPENLRQQLTLLQNNHDGS